MESSPESTEPTRRGLLIGLLRVALLVGTVLLVELVFRGLLLLQGAPYTAAKAEKKLRQLVSIMTETLPEEGAPARDEKYEAFSKARFIHPYLGWETIRGNKRSEAIYRESLGRRGAEATSTDSEYRIWTVGGSVAGQFGKGAGGRALAGYLERDARFEGKNVVVDSYGRGAYKQPQQVLLVAYLLNLGLKPDAVINIDGFNEVAIGNQNHFRGAHPLFPSTSQWGSMANGLSFDPRVRGMMKEVWRWQIEAERSARRTLAWNLHRSSILGWIGIQRLERIRAKWAAAYLEYEALLKDPSDSSVIRGLPIDGIGEHLFDILVENWVEGSRSLEAMCSARGIRYIHVLQPTLHDEGSKPLTREEVEGGVITDEWIEGARRGYPLLRAAGRALAEDGIVFADASLIFADVRETLYTDGCHYNDQGNEQLARFISDHLLENL